MVYDSRLKYNAVYSMTNENVACLSGLYDFENANVLTVLGSGDQYFTSLLNGAKSVTVFDINETAWLYFRIKFKALSVLSYEEFITLFIDRKFSDIGIYNKLYDKLSVEELKYYCTLANYRVDYMGYFHPNTIKNNVFVFANKEKFIPYLDRAAYYQLQEIVNRVSLPQFYHGNFAKMEVKPGFDILLLSNIFDYIRMSIFDFKKLIMQYDATYTLAEYSWHYDEIVSDFASMEFEIDEVLGVHEKRNYIASYKKRAYIRKWHIKNKIKDFT